VTKPQHKAAEVSGRNRSRRAQEAREREQRHAELLAEHDRGEHTTEPYNVSCAKCLALYKAGRLPSDPVVSSTIRAAEKGVI
jgi:hypothetical protein